MRHALTVGEMASLVGVSPHTVRYYCKIGLLSYKTTENGYKNFDYDAVLQLEALVMLRESGVSIERIKALFKAFSRSHYRAILKASYDNAVAEIERLEALKKRLDEFQNALSVPLEVTVTRRFERRYFYEVFRAPLEAHVSLKKLYDAFQKSPFKAHALSRDVAYLFTPDVQKIGCLVEGTREGAVLLEEGTYETLSFAFSEETQVGEKLKHFLKPSGQEVLFVIEAKASMQIEEGLIGTLSVRRSL